MYPEVLIFKIYNDVLIRQVNYLKCYHNILIKFQSKSAINGDSPRQSIKSCKKNYNSGVPESTASVYVDNSPMVTRTCAQSLRSSASEIVQYHTAPASSNDLSKHPESMQELPQENDALDLILKAESISNLPTESGKDLLSHTTIFLRSRVKNVSKNW